jgi:hypothetical protein
MNPRYAENAKKRAELGVSGAWAARVAALLLLAATGCGSSAPPPPSKVAGAGPLRHKSGRKELHVVKPVTQQRRSEQEPVIDEVPDPDAKRLFEERLADPAVALEPASPPPRVTSIALSDTARGEAAGMRPSGDITAATLAEGKRATMAVTLDPGACVTFIAQGGLGVIELDLFLVLADRSDGTRILAQDGGTGPIAVIGGHGRCYKNPRESPVAAELHATVRRGSGTVLVRGYRK